jgi:2-dehydro-3-deoxygluconokinase
MDIVSLCEPLYEFSQIPGEGVRYLQGFGGDTMNCAIAAARQGAKAGYITRLGNDEFGRQFLQLWRAEGLDTSGVGIDPQAHTAVYFITHGPDGHVFSYLRKGSAASRMRPADLPLELIRKAKFFHTSGISQAISDSACTIRCSPPWKRRGPPASGLPTIPTCACGCGRWPVPVR